MATFNHKNVTLTRKGASVLGRVQSGVGYLTITRVVASSQRVAESTLRDVTNVPSNLDMEVVGRTELEDGGSAIQIQLNNLNLTAPFVLNEIGIYATHSVEPNKEFLYIIAQVDEGTGDRIPLYQSTPVTAVYDFYLYNVGSDEVEVTISSTGLVTYEALYSAIREHNTASQAHRNLVDEAVRKADSNARSIVDSAVGTSITAHNNSTEAHSAIQRSLEGKISASVNNHNSLVSAHSAIQDRFDTKLNEHNASENAHANIQKALNDRIDEVKDSIELDLMGNDPLSVDKDGGVYLNEVYPNLPVRLVLTEDEDITMSEPEFYTTKFVYDSEGNITLK